MLLTKTSIMIGNLRQGDNSVTKAVGRGALNLRFPDPGGNQSQCDANHRADAGNPGRYVTRQILTERAVLHRRTGATNQRTRGFVPNRDRRPDLRVLGPNVVELVVALALDCTHGLQASFGNHLGEVFR